MANPQKENGYTPIANELYDALIISPIRGEVRRIIDLVIRKTYGFHKKIDSISLTQFEKATGMKRSCVCRALKEAVAKQLLLKSKNGYAFNKNYHQWVVAKRLPLVAKMTFASSQTANLLVAKQLHTKDSITKDTNTKDKAWSPNGDINLVIGLFNKINPTISFNNLTNRNATEYLINKFGLEKTISMIEFSLSVQGKKFAPVITTPYQLKEKLGQLIIYYEKENNNSNKYKATMV